MELVDLSGAVRGRGVVATTPTTRSRRMERRSTADLLLDLRRPVVHADDLRPVEIWPVEIWNDWSPHDTVGTQSSGGVSRC